MPQHPDTMPALVLRAPTFPATAFERERSRVLVGLRAQEQNPGALAERAFYRALYGAHPYAQPPLGTAQSVAALKRADVLAHYRRNRDERDRIVERAHRFVTGQLSMNGALDRLNARLCGLVPASRR